jgi:hypothetical protein
MRTSEDKFHEARPYQPPANHGRSSSSGKSHTPGAVPKLVRTVLIFNTVVVVIVLVPIVLVPPKLLFVEDLRFVVGMPLVAWYVVGLPISTIWAAVRCLRSVRTPMRRVL